MNEEPKAKNTTRRKKIIIACAGMASVYLLALIGSIVWVIAQFLIVPPLPPVEWTTVTIIGSKPLCGTWQIMTGLSGNSDIDYVKLKAIAAVTDDDVWAVGVKGNEAYFNHSQPKASPLTVHWD